VYTPRKDNSKADALSRRIDITRTKKVIESTILKINTNRSLGPAKIINNII
jgi:hypothetical protein